MAAGIFRPEEWRGIVRRLINGEQEVAQQLVDRERRLDQFFGDFIYTPTVSQTGGQVVAGNGVVKGEIVRFGNRVFLTVSGGWISSDVSGSATDPVISITLPDLLNDLQGTGTSQFVGFSWFETLVLDYLTGGVTFTQNKLVTWPANSPYTTPPTYDLADFISFGLFATWRVDSVTV